MLHVWSPTATLATAYGGMVTLPTYNDDGLRKAATAVAEAGCRRAREVGLHAKPEIADVTDHGTRHAILEVADTHDASLIVVGARGLSTFKSMVLGSISHGVAQHSHRPVLVVPPAVAPREPAAAVQRESVTA